jgi:hypothetical protein
MASPSADELFEEIPPRWRTLGVSSPPVDVPATPFVRRSERLAVKSVLGGRSRSVNEAVQAQLPRAPVDDKIPEQSTSASSKKRGRGLTPVSEEEAFSPSEKADDSDDAFRESCPVKQPRLVLSTSKLPNTYQRIQLHALGAVLPLVSLARPNPPQILRRMPLSNLLLPICLSATRQMTPTDVERSLQLKNKILFKRCVCGESPDKEASPGVKCTEAPHHRSDNQTSCSQKMRSWGVVLCFFASIAF